MKKYLNEIFMFFLLPAVLIAGVAEFSLRKIPNDYAFKNQWLTKNSHEVEVLALGASTVLFDIDPAYFQKKGFNAAHVSQSLKYDHMIFHKFIDQMPSLEYVIMSIDYWSAFVDLEESTEWWRVKYYNIHYGSKFHRWEGKYNYELYFHDMGTFKAAAKGLMTFVGLKNETRRTVNDLGYGINYTLDNRLAEWDNGTSEASRHNKLIADAIHRNHINQNKHYVEDMIQKSVANDVKVILINVPLYSSYRDNLDKKFVKQQKDFCRYFAEKYVNVLYHDFSDDPRFTAEDYFDVNHLNEKGTEKLTRTLDSLMVYHHDSSY